MAAPETSASAIKLESTSPSPPPGQATTKTSWRWKVALALGVAIPIFFETLDYTGTAYLLTSTVFLPIFAGVADVYGRHIALQSALIIFAVGSALSTGAQSMPMMLAGRGIAGVGAAGMLTAVRVILADSRSLDESNWQMTVMFMLYTAGFSVGPVIGGALLHISFRWIFAINLPAAVAGSVLAFLCLRTRTKPGQSTLDLSAETQPSWSRKFLRIDWVGGALFTAAGILILLALNWGSSAEWSSAKVIVCFVVGALLFVACMLWEYYLERAISSGSSTLADVEPILPLDLFMSKDVNIVQYASFASGMVMMVMFYFVAIFMVIVEGLDPQDAGISLIFFAPGMGVGAVIVMQVIKRFRQPKYLIQLSGVVTCVALGLVAHAVHTNNRTQVKWFMAMAGVGTGLALSPLALQARYSMPESRNAVVVALTLFTRALGGTVGLAQCGAIVNAKATAAVLRAVEHGVIAAADAQKLGALGLESVDTLGQLSPAAAAVVRQAFANGVMWAFYSLIPWCGIAWVATLALSRIPDSDVQPQPQQQSSDAEK